MIWSFTPDRPIYLQLQEILKLSIVSGLHPPGSKLPAVRDLALEAAVNPNTVQRALTELEREGLVHAQRTSGRFVTEDTVVIGNMKNQLALELVDAFLEKMHAIGYGARETAELIGAKYRETGDPERRAPGSGLPGSEHEGAWHGNDESEKRDGDSNGNS